MIVSSEWLRHLETGMLKKYEQVLLVLSNIASCMRKLQNWLMLRCQESGKLMGTWEKSSRFIDICIILGVSP